jgi:hypothetical protein
MIRAELEPSTRARTIVFVTRAELAQDFLARVELELELYCLLNEPSPNRQYPLRIGSFTPLSAIIRYPYINFFLKLIILKKIII